MISIENSDTFKKEYRGFSERISAITNDQIKDDLNKTLSRLLQEVRNLDSQHMDIFARKDLVSNAQDSRTKITELRQYIDRRLVDWERSIKLKD